MSVRGGEAATIIVACGVTAVRSRCRRCWRWVAKPLPLENTAAIAKEHFDPPELLAAIGAAAVSVWGCSLSVLLLPVEFRKLYD
ncbi:uncharacterized protein DS421_2g53290 [Arachis hypogaea]|nr:uncharacterized protein DS421_2g53290 [Arachis hypogaea]